MARSRSLSLLLVATALLPLPSAQGEAPERSECRRPGPDTKAIGAFLAARCYADWPQDREAVRKVGPTPGARSPHGKVRVYYSPEVYEWLKRGRPLSGIPDGGMIYKVMFGWESEEESGGAYMLKRRGTSFDGWYWGGFGVKSGQAWGAWANGGCLNCHASADNPELTFSDLRRIEPAPEPNPEAETPGRAPHSPKRSSHTESSRRRARARRAASEPAPPPVNRAFVDRFPAAWPEKMAPPLGFPDEDLGDDVVPGPGSRDAFLTAANCAACHTANTPDVMSLPAGPGKRAGYVDISPAGEWSGSLMALAGRDPVFHAQLEVEKQLRPKLASFIDDTCYSCHGAMGQRQLKIDAQRPFSHAMIFARPDEPDGKYGTLARDGISCMVCHHMAARGLGRAESFTGRFAPAERGRIYGPYSDDVKTLPMSQAIGFVPEAAAHIRSAGLCGTCHSVLLPRLASGATKPSGPPIAEQTTYLEWRHSAYQDERGPLRPEARSCQGCHMPVALDGRGRPLATRIADIEEYMRHITHSLPKRAITLEERTPFGRHTLVGANYFVLEMFAQFARLLGLSRAAPDDTDSERTLPALDVSRRETANLASQAASVEIVALAATGKWLEARVRVVNLAGHKLPSGVGFRRAFLTVEARDGAGEVVWSSGRSDELGFLVGQDGRPLPSELTSDPRALQPHHRRITSEQQVQIYEERNVDEKGALTSSFLGLWRRVKDNRLLPRGFARTAPAELRPVAVAGDPDYATPDGLDETLYRLPLDERTRTARTITATLYYQAIPPGYLAWLFRIGRGVATQRLYHIASRLRLAADSPIAGWKLPLATTERPIVW